MSHTAAVTHLKFTWLLLLVGLLLSLIIAQQVRQQVERDAVERFAFSTDQVTIKIEERLRAYALVLRGGAALFDASDSVSREEWRSYTDKLHASETVVGIQGIGFAALIPPAQLYRHIATVRAEGFPDYTVSPAGERELYSAIVYLEPFRERNLRAFGYDMFAEPVRRAAMIRARDSGRAALSGKVALVQENGSDPQSGTLMYVPVYRRGAALDTLAQRREALIGWSYSPYRMDDLMAGILGGWERLDGQALGLRIYDGSAPNAQGLLFSSHPLKGAAAPSLFYQQRLLDFNGRHWLLAFDHLQPALGVDYTGAWATLLGGVGLSGLLFALLLSMVTTRVRAERIAEQLTVAILEREGELKTLLERLQTITSRLPGMVYEYLLQPDGRASFPWVSEGIRQIYRTTPEAVQGDDAAVIATLHPEDRAGVIDSIRRSARELSPWRHEYRVRFADGEVRWLFGDALPHRREEGSTLWYGYISDITERKESEMALRLAHGETRRFREALDYVSAYIYMKDTHSRYTYANRPTLELFGVCAEELVGSEDQRFFPPATVRRLHEIDARVFNGESSTEEVEVLEEDGQRRVYLEIKTPIYDEAAQGTVHGLLGISTDITALKEHERQLEHIAHYDALTNLPNRVLLADRLHQAMVQAQRRGHHLAVAYLDLDGFKGVNDRYGHDAGDQLLISVAGQMAAELREGDTLSRLGGDEFVAVLLDLDDVEASVPLLQRLLAAAARPVSHQGVLLQVSASLGVAFYPQPELVEADQLLRQADQAMYQAKLAGKGRYHVFDAEQDRSVRSHNENLQRIASALHDGELILHYQPKVNMRSGEVIGAEALIRWQHPQRGLLPPLAFLPLIEDHPLAVEVGEWVIATALRQMAQWQAEGLTLPVSVNIGARQLRQGDLLVRLQRLLAAHPTLPPSALELEVLV